jgi:hypothetical protein
MKNLRWLAVRGLLVGGCAAEGEGGGDANLIISELASECGGFGGSVEAALEYLDTVAVPTDVASDGDAKEADVTSQPACGFNQDQVPCPKGLGWQYEEATGVLTLTWSDYFNCGSKLYSQLSLEGETYTLRLRDPVIESGAGTQCTCFFDYQVQFKPQSAGTLKLTLLHPYNWTFDRICTKTFSLHLGDGQGFVDRDDTCFSE